MRLSYATMLLSVSVASRRWCSLSAAFIPSFSSRSVSTSPQGGAFQPSSGHVAGGRKNRRVRAKPSSDTLAELIERNDRRAKIGRDPISMMKSTTQEFTETEVDSESKLIVDFPLMGKSVDEVPPRMRFAPSPTGSLHVGGARTALYNWLVAQKGKLDFQGDGSAFVVRVEDTDLERSTKESEISVLDDLRWLGLKWDEGPDIDAQYGPFRQSERSHIYKDVAAKLMDEGKAYRCFCTKEELDAMREKQEAQGVPVRYDGTWRDADPAIVEQKLAEGAPYTVRFKVPPGARVVIDDFVRGTVSWDAESTVGDFILLRSNGVPVYNFCVAVDDAAMGITTVIRAEEHLTNTLRQGLILDALSAPRPRYAHCSLILGEDKQKLSKRHGATSCNQYRIDGFLPDAMINYLALLGWNDGTDNEIYSREELIDAFEVDRIVKSPSVFDIDKLRWVNSQHLKMMTIDEVVPMVREQFEIAGIKKTDDNSKGAQDFILAATSLAKQMMETTRSAVTNAETVLGYNLPSSFGELKDDEAKDMIKTGYFYSISKRLIESFKKNEFPMPDNANLLAAFTDAGGQYPIEEDNELGGGVYSYPQAYKVFMTTVAKDLGVKGKHLFHPIRLALTGEMSGQDVTKQLSLVAMLSSSSCSFIQEGKADDMVVTFEDRMKHLESFLQTIPTEYHVPVKKKKKSETDKADVGQGKKGFESKGEVREREEYADVKESYDGPPITALDIRVGVIRKVWEHEQADKLFCEEIDVGEEKPRLIASGLRPFFQKEDLENRKVLVLCNLKARKMLGFPSHGMVLCAGNEDHTDVRFVSPPSDSNIGERVTVPGWEFDSDEAQPFAENKMGKKKVFEKIAPFLKTSKHGVAEFLGSPLMTSAGVCTTPLPGASVS